MVAPELYNKYLHDTLTQINDQVKTAISPLTDIVRIVQIYDEIFDIFCQSVFITHGQSRRSSIQSIKQMCVPNIPDITIFPFYIIDKLKELITNEFTQNNININKLYHFNLLHRMGINDKRNIEELLELLINKTSSWKFDFTSTPPSHFIIEIFNKIKIGNNFIRFIRSFLRNIFNHQTAALDLQIIRSMLYDKYDEIPLNNILVQLLNGKTINHTHASLYDNGLTPELLQKPELIFDMYYLEHINSKDSFNKIKR